MAHVPSQRVLPTPARFRGKPPLQGLSHRLVQRAAGLSAVLCADGRDFCVSSLQEELFEPDPGLEKTCAELRACNASWRGRHLTQQTSCQACEWKLLLWLHLWSPATISCSTSAPAVPLPLHTCQRTAGHTRNSPRCVRSSADTAPAQGWGAHSSPATQCSDLFEPEPILEWAKGNSVCCGS